MSDHTKSLVHWLALSGVQTEVSEDLRQWFAEPVHMPDTAAATSPTKPAAPPPIELDVKFNTINELNEFIQQWKRLGIAKTATHTILGSGQTNPCLMVICDTPDAHEDQKGEGFIGAGNHLIKSALLHAGFPSDNIYMTYLSKWRPPGQKALSPAEIAILSSLLHQEIGFVRPQAILAIGESSLKALGFDSLRQIQAGTESNLYKNQYLNYEIPVLASQKGEFLVKTPGMKKNFWLSIINFATALRAKGVNFSVLGSPSVNYTE